ncbi:MAG: flagellar FlbD family protein [Acidobacteria bacterium]|nr:flagellar FlbD family protein [Acidobacteriota bacterium]
MIQLTRLNHAAFYLNADLIEFIEKTPETVLTTVNGWKVRVEETPEQVVERVVEYRRRVWPYEERQGQVAGGR